MLGIHCRSNCQWYNQMETARSVKTGTLLFLFLTMGVSWARIKSGPETSIGPESM